MANLSSSIGSLVRRSLLLAGLCALTVAFVPGTAGAAQVGAVADITWGQPRSAVDREIEMLKDAGVGWVRANASWNMLEPNGKGRIDQGALANYDYAIDRARAVGLEVLMPISDGVPYWASGDPDKYVDSSGKRHWKRLYQPADMADYGDIVRFVAEHFGDRVGTYEIWNEPNHPWFWASGPDPAAYVPMLKAGYQAVKRMDPGATVLLGGLSKSDYRFLEGVYEAGGGPYFDAVAVHPYTGGVDPTWAWNDTGSGQSLDRLSWNCFPAIQEVKATMDAHGDEDKQVWLTEFGYSTTTAAYGVSPQEQAAYLTKAYDYIEQFEWVHSMFWYSARNLPSAADSDSEPAQYGLMSTTFAPKPAYWALRDHARGKATDPVVGTPPPLEAEPAPVPEPAPAPGPVVPDPVPVPELQPAPTPGPAPTTPTASPSTPVEPDSEPRFPAKLEVSRSRVVREDRSLDVLAAITARASGAVEVGFQAAGRDVRFDVPIDADEHHVRFEQRITDAQARLGTGIMTLSYPGNERTRPQVVRLRAASGRADLELERPRIRDGRLRVEGTVARRARGVVRIELEYFSDGRLQTHEARTRIREGAWTLDESLPAAVRGGIARRVGDVHSYVAYTGSLPARIRGEFESFGVDADD